MAPLAELNFFSIIDNVALHKINIPKYSLPGVDDVRQRRLDVVLLRERGHGVTHRREEHRPNIHLQQGVTKKCRQSLLTNSALVYESRGGGELRRLSQ
jgi:hypothetical protein